VQFRLLSFEVEASAHECLIVTKTYIAEQLVSDSKGWVVALDLGKKASDLCLVVHHLAVFGHEVVSLSAGLKVSYSLQRK